MALPWLHSQKEETASVQGTLCVLLGEQTISAALTYLTPTQTRVSTISLQRTFTNVESFIAVADECLSDLGTESEPYNQVVFCLSEHWADAHDILPEKTDWIRRLLTELSLQAVGFVGLVDAFTSLLIKENSKATQLVLFVFPQTITFCVVVANHVVTTLSVGRSEDFLADIKELSARIKTQLATTDFSSLKVTLASPDLTDTQLEQLQQQVLEFDWQEALGSSGVPQVDLIQQVALYRHVFHQTAEVLRSKQLGAAWTSDPVVEASQAVFGNEVAASVAAQAAPQQSPPMEAEVASDQQQNPTPESVAPAATRRRSRGFGLSKLNLSFRGRKKKLLIGGAMGAALGVLTTFVFAWYYLGHFASLLITVTPKQQTVTKDVKVSLAAGELKITDDYSLPVQTVSTEVEVSATKVATGKQTIGERAKGKLKIINKTEQSKNLDAGTEFTSGTGLVFTLDEATTVPAATVNTTETGETKEYGSIEAAVTAKAIGEESNIGSGQDLKVASFADSSYSAQSVEAFTGGTSQEVAVVSQKDIDSLRADLKQEAATEAEKKLNESKTEGMRVAPPHEVLITKETLSTEVGEQAEEVTLTVTAKANAFAYSGENTRELALAVLKDALPEGTSLAQGEPQVLAQFTEDDAAKEPQLELNVSAQAVSAVDAGEVAKRLAGRPIESLTQQAVDVPGVEKVAVQWSPGVASLVVDKVPDQIDRIQIHVQE